MKIRVKLGCLAAAVLLLTSLNIHRALAQYGAASNNPYGGFGGYGGFGTYGGFGAYGYGNYWNVSLGTLSPAQVPRQGNWSEVINVSSKWIVVQDQNGRQYPISSDSVKQFLVRWPSTVDQLTPASIIEATGVDAGSNVVIADHLDIYEADAQRLVTPGSQNLYGANRVNDSLDNDHNAQFDVAYAPSPDEIGTPNRVNVVGHIVGKDPVLVQTEGNNFSTLQPGNAGMTVTQVTIGNNSYAKKGDLVYVISDSAMPRSLNIAQLVLYKKIALRAFQP